MWSRVRRITSAHGAFYVQVVGQCGCRMLPDFRGVIFYKPVPCGQAHGEAGHVLGAQKQK